MSEKILSVSIASYNIEDYLEDTVRSITDSDVADRIEIIIVNDGSKDKTSEIAHALKDEYPDSIKVIDKANGGYGSTINASIEIASGKYYKLLDGDDWYDTGSLGDFIRFLGDCEADIVVSPYYKATSRPELCDDHCDIDGETVIADAELENALFYMHEIAVRTSTFREFDYRISENCFYTDIEFTCFCFIPSKTLARFEKPIYCYRLGVDGQSVSLSGIRKHFRDHTTVMKHICECYMENADTITGTKKSIVDRWVSNLTRNTFIAYLVLSNPKEYRRELIEFDSFISSGYPQLYSIGNRSRFVKTIRRSGFRPYKLWCKYALREFK